MYTLSCSLCLLSQQAGPVIAPQRQPMDQVSASEIALQIPDLLGSILRCLGPLEWVKCASVCPDWCDTILSRDEAIAPGGAAEATSTTAATPATGLAASTSAAMEIRQAARSTDWDEREKTAAAAAAGITADLWREFALALMASNKEDTTSESDRSADVSNRSGADKDGGCPFSNSESTSYSCSFNPDAAGVTTLGGRMPSFNQARGYFYRNVCLEGDPAVLGPPLRAMIARVGSTNCRVEVEVATVSLTDVTAASLARYRQRR